MARNLRWDPCIAHRHEDVPGFINEYFGDPNRRTLLIAGAGFDPRSVAIATQLADAQARLSAIFIKEERPSPQQDLVDLATANGQSLKALITSSEILPVDIFGPDEAVVGGRNVTNLISRQQFRDVTDVVVDLSALSIGISFPIIRYFAERIEKGQGPANLHVFVSHNPGTDTRIKSVASDSPGFVHGFRGGFTLDRSATAARLWLPQLEFGRRIALGRLFDLIKPHDTCPILPFPARDPRTGDALVEEYLAEFQGAWQVDASNIVYADEGDPLDLYRTILRLYDLRQRVFDETGGSLLVLSPLGSKLMALGALMAALERDLPVAYLEAIEYNLEPTAPKETGALHFVHVWLEGDVYPSPRPKLFAGGLGR